MDRLAQIRFIRSIYTLSRAERVRTLGGLYQALFAAAGAVAEQLRCMIAAVKRSLSRNNNFGGAL